jgi:D-3-phosphoglycerate dehydrogenase
MNVYGTDIKKISEDFITNTDIKMVSLSELLINSDFITLHCDLNDTSFHLIGRDELKLMKPDSVLINTSRGEVIDQSVLERSLQKNEISGAALDVFEIEPLPSNSKFRQLENVYLSPHNSNASPKVFNKVDDLSIKNLFLGLDL